MPAFVDTNVAVYALGRDSDKKARAKQVLDAAPIASSQVINEAISVLTGKQRFAREEAYEVADALMKLVAVAPVTANTVRDAMTLGLRYGLNHWDALIVAAALSTDCDTLYSEDMQDGQVFEGRLTVKNPFIG
ncbi:MAG: PIN domain-containing protein [Sulfuritalea sp.]|nr:PIN domain-containing protein [Sulfuritalea sp.]